MDLDLSTKMLTEIKVALPNIREWFKKTQLKFGWSRCYAKESEESPWATAESLLGLYFLGEPLNSLAIRRGFLYYFHNFPEKKYWNELVWNPRTIDALPWSIEALALGRSNMCKKLCEEALSALIERGSKCGRYWPDDSVMVLYTCAMTLKALHLINGKRELQELQEYLVSELRKWKAYDGGYGTQVGDRESDPCYTAHILEAFLDIGATDQKEIEILTNIIKKKRKKDGGWNNGAITFPDETLGVSPEESNVEATSQCVVALLKSGEPLNSEYIVDGIKWLLNPKLRNSDYGFRLTETTEVRNFATYYAAYAFLHYNILAEFYRRYQDILKDIELDNRVRRLLHNLAFDKYFSQLKLRDVNLNILKFSGDFPRRLFSTKEGAAKRRLQILSLLDKHPMTTLELTKAMGLNPRTAETKVKEDIKFLVEAGLVFEESPGSYWTILDVEL